MGTMKRKYKLNEAWPTYPNAAVNGVNFDADTVVEGEQWERYAGQLFSGKPAQLVQANNDKVATKPDKGTPAARQEQREKPKPMRSGSSHVFGSVMEMDEEREAAETAPAVPPETEVPNPKEVPKAKAPKPPVKVLVPEHERRAQAAKDKEANSGLELTDIRGVGDGRAEQIAAGGFETVEAVAGVEPQALLAAIKGSGARMNLATAKAIVKSAKGLLK